MKKIILIVVIVILIAVGWYSWTKMNKVKVLESPEQVLDKSTQADTIDEIDVKLKNIDIDTDSSADFDSIDDEIKGI